MLYTITYGGETREEMGQVHDAKKKSLGVEGQELTALHRRRLQLHLVVVNRQRSCNGCK
jgi:hypothetical protein